MRETDAVVLEATTNAWYLCDQLRPLVSFVTVAHPLLVKVITTARVKTDARNTLHLARLLAADLIPTVWVPPEEVRELWAFIAHRTRLIRQLSISVCLAQSKHFSHNLVLAHSW